MKNHSTKETCVILIISFWVQPRKAVGKTILFPFICARFTEKCRKFQSKKKLTARNFWIRGGGETQWPNNWIHTSGHVMPLLMGKEERKNWGFLIEGMGARAYVITPNDYCWVFITKWDVNAREIRMNKRKLRPFSLSFNDHWYLSRLFSYMQHLFRSRMGKLIWVSGICFVAFKREFCLHCSSVTAKKGAVPHHL